MYFLNLPSNYYSEKQVLRGRSDGHIDAWLIVSGDIRRLTFVIQ